MNPSEPDLAPVQENSQGEMTELIQFAKTLYRFRWHVVTILAAAFVVGVFYAANQRDVYQSTSTILIDDTQTRTTAYTEAAPTGTSTQSKEYMDTQLVIATSMPVLVAVAKDLDAKTYFNVESDQLAAATLQKETRAYQQRKTNIFSIEVTDYDPHWAAKFANAIAVQYTRESMRQSLMTNQQLLRLLPGGSETDPTAVIEKMSDPYFIESLPSIQENVLIQELKKDKLRYEAELAKLRARYTDENPTVIEMIRNLSQVEERIKLEIANTVAGLKRTLSGEVKSSKMSIFETGKVPTEPSGPDRVKIVLVFLIVGFLAACAVAAFLGALMTTISSEDDLAQIASVPYLGYLPLVDSKKKELTVQDILENQSTRDAIAMLHTALIFSMPKDKNKLIMVTSSVEGEGKSSVSALLAYTMARLGTDKNRKILGTEDKVLIIEADIRKPGISDKIGISDVKTRPGLADFLIGTAEYEQVVTSVPGFSNLDIIPAGSVSKNPEALFTSSAFDDLIRVVEKNYTRVIIDSPPFLSIPEASIISQKVHGTMFVIGSGLMNRRALMRAFDKFRLLNTNLYGTVLNRLDIHHDKHYHGYQYKGAGSK
jgi:capsular exopolysaccharide synthesis family protein